MPSVQFVYPDSRLAINPGPGDFVIDYSVAGAASLYVLDDRRIARPLVPFLNNNSIFSAQSSGAPTLPTFPAGWANGTPKWIRLKDQLAGKDILIPVFVAS